MDGLHGQESGQAYLDRWVLDYNHFKDHKALDGEVPARAAKVSIVLDEWTDVVREADKFKAAERAVGSERAAQRKAEARAMEPSGNGSKARKGGRGKLRM